MFFKKYKEKAAHKILKKGLLSGSGERNAGNDKVSSLACLVNLDEFEDVEAFKDLARDIQVRQEHFRIMGYTGRKDANAYFGIPVFRKEDLGWKGEIRNDRYRQLLEKALRHVAQLLQ